MGCCMGQRHGEAAVKERKIITPVDFNSWEFNWMSMTINCHMDVSAWTKVLGQQTPREVGV